MSDNAIVVASSISKSYPSGGRQLDVLKNLDFSATAGEMIAVVGSSGIGKSTLLHVLGGIDRPDSGLVLHNGQDLVALDDVRLARFRNKHVGFVFQFHYLLPEFTALENVMMPCLIAGQARRKASDEAEKLLTDMGIAERAHHRPGELSGGEQQRVAIARSLVRSPQLVLADEPTGDLDAATGEQVFDAFENRVREQGVTTIMATHNEKLAFRCNRVFRMVSGRLEPVTRKSARAPADE